MSTFVKNYHSPKNPGVFLSVSWEMGYRNIQVRYKDRLVHTIPQPAVLVDGVKIQDDEFGTIKFRFTTERPRKLEIKVNNKKFKTVNKRDLGYDYTGLITIFTSLCVFALMETVMIGGAVSFELNNALITILFTLGFLIAIAYGFTSYLLSKRKNWSYFMGTTIFTLTSILATIGIAMDENGLMDYVIFIIRMGMLLYIYLQLKHILKEVKKTRILSEDVELLDS